MKRKLLLPMLLIAASSIAFGKKHPSLPEVFESAHTVFVESLDGDITNLKLDSGDRAAILNTQDGIHSWPRYTLTGSRLDADLILVVHKGRLVPSTSNPGANSGLSAPSNPRNPSSHTPLGDPSDASQGPATGNSPGGFTQEKDQLQVFTLDPKGKLNGPIWTGEQDHGLDSPQIHLLKRLREDVEKAYPTPPPTKPTTP